MNPFAHRARSIHGPATDAPPLTSNDGTDLPLSEERGVIFAEHQRGNSQRGIGRILGRPTSTIGRERARGRQEDDRYCL